MYIHVATSLYETTMKVVILNTCNFIGLSSPGFSTRNLMHDRIARHETPSVHTAIKWEARLVTAVGRI